jgi:hypothetical protein
MSKKKTKAAAPIMVPRDYRNLNVLELLAKYADQPERADPPSALRPAMVKVDGYVVQSYWRRKQAAR